MIEDQSLGINSSDDRELEAQDQRAIPRRSLLLLLLSMGFTLTTTWKRTWKCNPYFITSMERPCCLRSHLRQFIDQSFGGIEVPCEDTIIVLLQNIQPFLATDLNPRRLHIVRKPFECLVEFFVISFRAYQFESLCVEMWCDGQDSIGSWQISNTDMCRDRLQLFSPEVVRMVSATEVNDTNRPTQVRCFLDLIVCVSRIKQSTPLSKFQCTV